MKNLLIVTTVPSTITCFLLPFVRHFRSLGWQVGGMAQGIDKCDRCMAEFDRVWDIQWSRNPLDPRNLVTAAPKVRKVVAQGNYDLVHVHTPVAAFVTRYALKNLRQQDKLQVFYTAHGFHFHPQGNALKNAIFIGLEKLAGSWTDRLITINREDEIAARKYCLLPEAKIHYTPGIGVDLKQYNRDRFSTAEIATVRDELNLLETDSLLLCIAEFIPRKRHTDLVRALHQLNRPHIHLALAGAGNLQPEIKQLVIQLGLQKQVHFLGFRADIPQLISASDGLLLVSQQEGLPRSIMEAFAIKTPVIGTNIRGIKDLLEQDCGLLVEVGDIKALSQAMAWIIDNPELAQKMSQRSYQKITGYDVNNIIKIYEQLYARAFNPEKLEISNEKTKLS